jgi:hypothetical protein
MASYGIVIRVPLWTTPSGKPWHLFATITVVMTIMSKIKVVA